MKRINIEIPTGIKSLTYNSYGKEIYETQVKDKVDFSDVNEIVFPDHVEKASSSFVRGFFAEPIDTIGISGVLAHFEIVSPNERLKTCFKEGLL